MPTTEALTGFGLALAVLIGIGSAFKIYYGQVAEVRDAVAKGLELVRADMLKAFETLRDTTDKKIEAESASRHSLADKMQGQMNDANRTFVGRDDFFRYRTEILDAIKELGTKVENRRGA